MNPSPCRRHYIVVAVSDFPCFDGSTSVEDFLAQCKGQATLCVQSAQYRTRSSEIAFLRTVLVWLSTCIPYQLNIVSDYAITQYRTNASEIAHLVRIVYSGLKRLCDLGSVAETNLGKVVAARCTGRALQVVNQLDSKELTFTAVSEALTANFTSHPTAEQAAVLLSRLSKGSLSAREYGQRVKTLVRHACPEFFSEDGLVKKICVPSHDAALYRHFLVGLSPDETSLLSRMKATTFTAAMAELVREETLVDMTGTGEGDTFSTAPVARGDRPAVRWASPVHWDRSDELCYERGAPSRRRSPDGGYRRPGAEDYDPDGWAAPRGRRDGSPVELSNSPKFYWNAELDESFRSLRDALLRGPVLSYPRQGDRFVLYTDSSISGSGQVLCQIQDGAEVIAYGGTKYNRAQRKWTIFELEVYSFIQGLRRFYKYLEGDEFTWHCDCKSALQILSNRDELNPRIARWRSFADQFRFVTQQARSRNAAR